MTTSWLLLACCLGMLGASHAKRTALDDYVQAPDPTYKWEKVDKTYNWIAATGYVLNVTSQKWLTSADSDRSIWWHTVVVIVPFDLRHTDVAQMYITGNGNTPNEYPKADDEDLLLSVALAVGVGSITCTVYQVPNEPIHFPTDPAHKRRTEDSIIAFTWSHFLNNTDEPNWLLRLPMTKAAIAAMNATTEFVLQHNSRQLNRWIVAGASKRGWTTWTVAAVEPRVIAFIPLVMDLANMIKNIHHMWRNLGGWTFAFKDYWDLHLLEHVDAPAFQLMADVVDPYSYFDRYTKLPKLFINSGDDEFFQPDDNYYWWNDLQGEKHLIMCQDAEHSLVTALPEVVQGILAFSTAVIKNVTRPEFTWDMDFDNGTITVFEQGNQRAHRAKLRWAHTLNETRRDFRWIVRSPEGDDGGCELPLVGLPGKKGVCLQPILWAEEDLHEIRPGVYQGVRPIPKKGWTAMFIEMYYKSPSFTEYRFTTQIMIIPNKFAFPPCVAAGCQGELV